MKKKRDAADAGVIEAAIDKRLASTIGLVTFHVNLGLDMGHLLVLRSARKAIIAKMVYPLAFGPA